MGIINNANRKGNTMQGWEKVQKRVLDQFDLEAEAEGSAIRRSNNLRPKKTPGWRTMKNRQKIERGKRIVENRVA